MAAQKTERIKRSLIFLAILLTTFLLINTAYIELYEKNTKSYRKEIQYQEFIQGNSIIPHAFFGDSHVRAGANPHFLPKGSFNFGLGGEDYVESYYKLQRSLKQDKIIIKNIYLQLDVQSFSSWNRHIEPVWYDYHYISPELVKYSTSSHAQTFLEAHFPVLGKAEFFGTVVLDYVLGRPLPEMYRGWSASAKSLSPEDVEGIDHIEYAAFFEGQEKFDPVAFNHFIKILDLAEKHDISIYIIHYPVTEKFMRTLDHYAFDREKYVVTVLTLLDKRGYSYKVLDYYTLLKDQPKYFKDSHHVNKAGSEVLSKKISEDIS